MRDGDLNVVVSKRFGSKLDDFKVALSRVSMYQYGAMIDDDTKTNPVFGIYKSASSA